ncbi:uncharacterized protein LOC105429733 isoform X2 [Pogonomyrmex barbatus]|uniref:Uncharacterized protein LOC105429733 isoform X2 n=2 Tax=Pogonomyrmex barbatus TaxID=144034 RepID=A0A6I9WIN6_9HYME|nr:uncharacterized protein LOC105429733 isoform X2 [Pogonomyrmex barbatus]
MDVEQDGFCKSDSAKRRLKLRKNYKESADDKTHFSEHSNNDINKDTIHTYQASCDDDSILDFKSPKKIHSMQSKVVNSSKPSDNSKKKIHSKPKIINNERKLKSRKSLQNKKIPHNVQQPLIESSFFKSEKKETDSPQNSIDIKTAYVCPLCFKNFKDESSHAVHMKSCAMKNNVSTKKLMDVVELQERQAAERKSLGLLSAPILQDKKKSVPRKMASNDDPDLQLALALSKSLYEKEEMEEWDEVQIVAISSNSSVPDNNIDCLQQGTLQNFGFSSSRNTLPINNWPTSKSKKRKLIEPTILQRRTAADRERILTERIAEILMGCKDFTQRSQEEVKEFGDKERIVIKNQLLQQLRQTENTLWDRTKLIPTQNAFYVEQLSSQITPMEKKEQEINEEQNIMKLLELNVSNERCLDNKQMQKIKKIEIVKTMDNNEALTIMNTDNTCCKEKKFLDDLAVSWRKILNDSSASDIIVFVQNSKHIWAHKLVFYTRCANILLDVIPNDTEFSTVKEKICWIDTDYDVALAFLEFLYCGVIDKHSKIFHSETALSNIRALGRKYKINDLFVYLRQKMSDTAEVKHNYKNTENIHLNVETVSDFPKLGKSCNTSPNCTRDVIENIQCSQKTLQRDVNDKLHSLENNYTSARDSCILQDEKMDLKLSVEINSRSNTPTKWETSVSPDIFDDMPVTKYKNKSIVHSKDHEDANIHILLSLIKQDADADIYSQRLSTTKNAEYSEVDKDISTHSKNMELNVMEIEADSELNSLICPIDNIHEDFKESQLNSLKSPMDNMHKNSLIDILQNSKSKYTQDRSSDIMRQKSDLTLFIERVQEENAKLDLELNSDIKCHVQISPTKHKNPFYIDKDDDSEDLQSYDNNIKQSTDMKERLGRLTIMEQRIRSYATKDPKFYSRLSDEYVENIEQIRTNILSSSSNKITKSHNTLNNTQNFTLPIEKNVDISRQIITVPSVCSQSEMKNQSLNETIFDLETNEEDISMYSRYKRNHKDNSIAKYRAKMKTRNRSDSNLSDKSISSDSINEDSEIEKDDSILTQSVLTQKDKDVIVSDTEIESISSNVSHVVLENDDLNHENVTSHSQQFRKQIKDNEQNIENGKTSQLLEVEKFSETTNSEKEKSVTKSNQDKLDTTEMMFMTQRLESEPNDDQRKGSISSPIMVSSSPDFLNPESCSPVSNIESLLHNEFCIKNALETDVSKSSKFSLNFEEDIYLANVDIDKYEKQHFLEKSRSFNISDIREFKNAKTNRCNNKSNKNIKDNDIVVDDIIIDCENLDNNIVSLSQNVTNIRKLKRKSLSEGQININRLHNQAATRVQFQCNYVQNIENAKTPKIINKDVTPPPDYNDMSTPELHKKMKKYGLKAQKRGRAVRLLTHIYNELHPLVPISEETKGEQITEISSDEDEGPPLKKRNIDDGNLEKSNNGEDSSNELPCSQDREFIRYHRGLYETN